MINDKITENKIKENKYKILRMSLLLGNDSDREETIKNFEDSAIDIDNMNDETYEKEIDDKFYDTTTLEEEKDKLKYLVNYIGGRVEQRISLLNDFQNVTGDNLTGLPDIKYSDKLDEYKNRLKYIEEYINNTENLEKLKEELQDLEEKMKNTCLSKEKEESQNVNDEKILLEKYKDILSKNDKLTDVTTNNLDEELEKIEKKVEDSKKSLDIFNKSFSTLEFSGISEDEKEEYSSYVESAKENYYKNKEEEYLYNIYKLLLKSNKEYLDILYKRDSLHEILNSRLELREELNITDEDILEPLYELVENQYESINNQKQTIETIDYLSNEIDSREKQIKEIEEDNKKVEILSLLKEYNIIDVYEDFEPAKEETTEDFNIDLNNFDVNNFNTNNVDSNKEENTVSTNDNITSNSIDNYEIPYDKYEIPTPVMPQPAFDNTNNIINISNTLQQTTPTENINEPVEQVEVQPEMPVNNFTEINYGPTIEDEEQQNETIEPNQVVNVKDINYNVNIDEIINNANSVMKRVGKMLGIESEEKEKIVSVENNEEKTKEQPQEVKEEQPVEPAKEETTSKESMDIPILPTEPIVEETQNNTMFDNNMDQTVNMWDNTYEDSGLDSLPDLPQTEPIDNNNFFANNNFNITDMEAK